MTSKKVICTSLSGCLKAIVEGRIKIENVDCVWAKTAISSDGWEGAISRYKSAMYPDDSEKAEKLENAFDQLIEDDKIKQERLSSRERRPSRRNPIWLPSDVNVETAIIWVSADKVGDLPRKKSK